jgi:hypothetical protein
MLLAIEEVKVKPSLLLGKSLVKQFLDLLFDEVILRSE